MDKIYYDLFLSNFKNINYLDDKLLSIKNMPIVFVKKFKLNSFNQLLIKSISDFENLKLDLLDFYYSEYSFKKSIEVEIEKIEQIFKTILDKQLVKINNIENIYNNNNFVETIFNTSNNISQIRKRFIVLYNMFFGFENYIYDVDLSKYKKISKKDLKFADIILSIKSDKIINKSFYNKLIFYVTHSHIQHASIYYGKENNNYLFLDILETYEKLNELKFVKLKTSYSNDNVGLVLRYKNDLSIDEKNAIRKYLNSVIGKKYGLNKALFLSFLYSLYNKFSFYKKLKNPFSKNTLYCSENVVRAYESAEIFLSNKYDVSTITPVDLLNNAQLEIVGYLKK